MYNKPDLRKKYKSIRKNITDKENKSLIIAQRITSLESVKKAQSIALYNSLPDEVQTEKLITGMLDSGKKVYLPKVCGDEMEFYRIESIADTTEKGAYGIYEPKEESERLNAEKLDVIIIPGICFDLNKNRIGFGKGYYDGYLKKLVSTKKIAICFEEQVLKDGFIAAENRDIKPDIIVTQENIYI